MCALFVNTLVENKSQALRVPFQSLAFVSLLSLTEHSFSTSFLQFLGPIGNGAFISGPRPRVINSCFSSNPCPCLGIPPAHAKDAPLFFYSAECALSLSFNRRKNRSLNWKIFHRLIVREFPPLPTLLAEFLLQANAERKTTCTPPLPANTHAIVTWVHCPRARKPSPLHRFPPTGEQTKIIEESAR